MKAALACIVVLFLAAASTPTGQEPAQASRAPVFRSGVNLVLVDVVVRDKSGAVVKGLTADDFDLFEDGVRQQIRTFAFEEITRNDDPHCAQPIVDFAPRGGASTERAR